MLWLIFLRHSISNVRTSQDWKKKKKNQREMKNVILPANLLFRVFICERKKRPANERRHTKLIQLNQFVRLCRLKRVRICFYVFSIFCPLAINSIHPSSDFLLKFFDNNNFHSQCRTRTALKWKWRWGQAINTVWKNWMKHRIERGKIIWSNLLYKSRSFVVASHQHIIEHH